MKPHCVPYILYRDIGYGTLCSTALSIGVVSARGSNVKNFIRESVKKSLTQNYNIFCIFITIVYGGKSFSLELSNFSGHSGRARGLINDN